MQKILVLRFSAMGDVALCLPILRNVLSNNNDVEITVVTKKTFAVFFRNIDRLAVIGVDFNKKYNGVLGLYKLKNDLLQQYNFDTVVDLHDVLRTKVLRTYFKLNGKKIITFNKGREEKEKAVANKSSVTLPHITERYAEPFRVLNLKLSNDIHPPYIKINDEDIKIATQYFYSHKRKKNIGIAPIAKHATKTYPKDLMLQLIQKLSDEDTSIYLLGGKEDAQIFEEYEKNNLNCCSTIPLNISQQISLMQLLDVVISMDSANMHLSSLQGTPVISIWGGTQPNLGFCSIDGIAENRISSPAILKCQPCSVFGNKPCSNKQFPYECFYTIPQENIVKRINSLLPTK